PTARTATTFDYAPVTVLFAVLPSSCESQVHGPRGYAQTKIRKEGRSSLQPFPPHRPLMRLAFFRQNRKITGPVGKVGLAAGALIGSAVRPAPPPPAYYYPAPAYAAPPPAYAVPPPPCYFTPGAPVWDSFRGTWVRPRVQVCD